MVDIMKPSGMLGVGEYTATDRTMNTEQGCNFMSDTNNGFRVLRS